LTPAADDGIRLAANPGGRAMKAICSTAAVLFVAWAAGCQAVDDAVSNDPLLGSPSRMLPSEIKKAKQAKESAK
jgi:hypothetical protein